MPSKATNVVSWILAVVLAAFFGLAGVGKLGGGANEMYEGWGYPAWFALAIGVAEAAGAIGLLIPKTTRWAIYGLTAIMAGAVFTHVTNGEAAQLARPLIPTMCLWILWKLRSGS